MERHDRAIAVHQTIIRWKSQKVNQLNRCAVAQLAQPQGCDYAARGRGGKGRPRSRRIACRRAPQSIPQGRSTAPKTCSLLSASRAIRGRAFPPGRLRGVVGRKRISRQERRLWYSPSSRQSTRRRSLIAAASRHIAALHDHRMVDSTLDLVMRVRTASTPDAYWAAELSLLEKLEIAETLIHKRGKQKRQIREAIKQIAGSPNRPQTHLQRVQAVLASISESEAALRQKRNVSLYLGDALAFKLLPDHFIRVLGRNDPPGFGKNKAGREQEMLIAKRMTQEGKVALLHDLTHSLRVADMTLYTTRKAQPS